MRSREVAAEKVIAYWLLPASPAREFFRGEIRRLARACSAPVFEPHLTLAVGPDDSEEAGRILSSRGALAGPIILPITGSGFTPKFTETLFVRFLSATPLLELRDSLSISRIRPGTFKPHLSLLYHRIGENEQASLAAELQIPFTVVACDSLAAVECRLPVRSAADVAAWRLLGTRRLKLRN